MAEPPATNLSSSAADPPTHSTSSNPLEAYFAKHQPPDTTTTTSSSVHTDPTRSQQSYNASGNNSYNASNYGGDAPSIGYSIRSGDDHTIRSGYDGDATNTLSSDHEETANLLSGRSTVEYTNPYRKKYKVRFSPQQLFFGKRDDDGSSVISKENGRRKNAVMSRISQQRNASNNNKSGMMASLSSATIVTGSYLLRLSHLKKNATLLSIVALGMMIFIGGTINLSISEEVSMKNDQDRDLSLNNDDNVVPKNDNNANVLSLGIMNNHHPQTQGIASAASSSSHQQQQQQQQIDWNKVPPHLRGYYSKTFGPPPESTTENHDKIYRNEVDDYEHTQFSNKEQALAIQSIGREAVLGFRTVNNRDYHVQGELNKELTSSAGGMEFRGPMLGNKEEFVSQEGGVDPQQQQQPQLVVENHEVDSTEEQKRLAAQEAALIQTSTAEDDARKKRMEDLAQLRASAGLTDYRYSKETGGKTGEPSSQIVENVPQLTVEAQRQDENDAAETLELERQKAEAEAARIKAEEQKAAADADAMAKMKEEIRQRNEEAARKEEEKKRLEEERRKRQEDAAREQELARQQAAEKAAKLKLEYAQQQEEEERQKQGSLAQQLMFKYAHVPFKEQTKSSSVEESPKPAVPIESQQQQPQLQQAQQPAQEDPKQDVPDLSEWRNDVNAKFVERLKADEKVDHTAPKSQQPQSTHKTSLLTEKPRIQEKPAEETNYRLQIANGELPFDEWRAKMKEKLHNQIMAERAKNAPPEPNLVEVKDKVSQKMEEVEQAQSAVMKGESTDLESISALQKELSELLSLMGGGR